MYEEKMIDGILHYRHSPKEEFLPFSLGALSQRVIDLQDELEGKEIELDRAYYFLDSRKGMSG